MSKLIKQEACQLFIEQEIEEALEQDDLNISKKAREIADWLNKMFETDISSESIRLRIYRSKEKLESVRSVHPDVSIEDNSEITNNQTIAKDGTHRGGAREGSGRPTKFSALVSDEFKQAVVKEFQQEKKEEKELKRQQYREKESNLNDISNIIISKDDIKLHNCDILEAPVDDNSLDAVITDPPYPKEFLDCWDKLAIFSAAKLKDGGVLVVMSGQSYLPEVYRRMSIDGLNYYWTCCIRYTVSPNLRQKRLNTQWKPLLIYVKGDYTKTFLPTDVYDKLDYTAALDAQQYHKWGQSMPLMTKIITDWTYANELVCDPFMGGGTTIMAALEKKRRVIGIDIDVESYNITKRRLQC